jgi:hypothetical protein
LLNEFHGTLYQTSGSFRQVNSLLSSLRQCFHKRRANFAYAIALMIAFGAPYHNRPNGSVSEIRSKPRQSLRLTVHSVFLHNANKRAQTRLRMVRGQDLPSASFDRKSSSYDA